MCRGEGTAAEELRRGDHRRRVVLASEVRAQEQGLLFDSGFARRKIYKRTRGFCLYFCNLKGLPLTNCNHPVL
jgi:hypothetical protein